MITTTILILSGAFFSMDFQAQVLASMVCDFPAAFGAA
jgi:hypothetical protein